MARDIDINDRPEREPEKTRQDKPRRIERGPEKPASRESHVILFRGHAYRISPAQIETMREVGRFRTVAAGDLAHHRYAGNSGEFRQDLLELTEQGLVQSRSVWSGPNSHKLDALVLTKQAKALLEEKFPDAEGQVLHAGFVKAREIRHDAALYRMFQAESARIEAAGGRVRRVVLDYELKKKVYSPLAKAKQLAPLDYARKQTEIARQNGLTVVAGKIPLPDLRIEYETEEGEMARVDLELATGHYHARSLQEKIQAGFKLYAPEGDRSRLHRVLDEREITASILSL
jgi:hypothetical protein